MAVAAVGTEIPHNETLLLAGLDGFCDGGGSQDKENNVPSKESNGSYPLLQTSQDKTGQLMEESTPLN